MQTDSLLYGKVAYDVENQMWVMYFEDQFIEMSSLYESINRLLQRQGKPPLQIGDELCIDIKRANDPLHPNEATQFASKVKK